MEAVQQNPDMYKACFFDPANYNSSCIQTEYKIYRVSHRENAITQGGQITIQVQRRISSFLYTETIVFYKRQS